jgi:hypothetical protein
VGTLLAAVPAARAQEENETGMTLDEEFAQLAEAIPGFGGLYLDAEGTTHVYLQDLSHAREVQDLGERVEVHPGDYDFRDLLAWKDRVRDLLAQPGSVFLDIDEQRNRLLFGVERESLGAFTNALLVHLQGARVPAEAVLVEPAEPIVTQEQLTDTIRPVPAGVQIRPNGGTCTLGVNATRWGVRGFITNSHCTATRSVVDGTVVTQATTSTADQIGVETVDPPFFTGSPCPSGKQCRRSDAAFFAYDNGGLTEGGQIANPLTCTTGGIAGPLVTNPVQPRLPLTGFLLNSPVSGTILTKVGRTTGCTFGTLTNTCVDSNVYKASFMPGVSILTNVTMICQNLTSYYSQPGDSGSPVFRNKGGEAKLVGIHWGGNSQGAAYSSWYHVFNEIGGFVTPELP